MYPGRENPRVRGTATPVVLHVFLHKCIVFDVKLTVSITASVPGIHSDQAVMWLGGMPELGNVS